ncbi:MAG: hypothetical protein GY701_02710 [Sulfitobacter sp.]|nr:hypothetical protein [Sulfitobacter sp.]
MIASAGVVDCRAVFVVHATDGPNQIGPCIGPVVRVLRYSLTDLRRETVAWLDRMADPTQWKHRRFLTYMEGSAAPPVEGWATPGAAVTAWLTAHLATATMFAVVLASGALADPTWGHAVAGGWLLVASGLVGRVALRIVRPSSGSLGCRGPSQHLSGSVRVGLALAATGAAALVMPEDLTLPFVATLPLLVGARFAGLDAWSGLLRPSGFYRRAVLSRSGLGQVLFWLTTLALYFLGLWGFLVDGVLRDLQVPELAPRSAQYLQVAVLIALSPAAVAVCESIAAIARHEARLNKALGAKERARQQAVTARQLHDRALSLIPVLRMVPASHPAFGEALDELDTNLRQVLFENRLATGDLQLHHCFDRSVKHARLGSVDMSIEVRGIDTSASVEERAGVLIDRVLHELSSNALKAGATEIDARVLADEGLLLIEVIDDGSGFDPDQVGHLGGGLSSLTHALGRAGGSLDVSNTDEGSCVRATLPTARREEGSLGLGGVTEPEREDAA